MPNKPITRSTVNEQQYTAPEFPKSGFPLSYRRYLSGILGRIHINGIQWTMPGDKISGQSRGRCTFNRIVTPLVSPVNAMQYNVYLPLRPLDRSFKKGMTPTKLNAMSANWTMPLFNTRYLVDQIMQRLLNLVQIQTGHTWDDLFTQAVALVHSTGGAATVTDWYNTLVSAGVIDASVYTAYQYILYGATPTELGIINNPIHNLTTSGTDFCNMADDLYLRDALLDIAASYAAKLGSLNNPISGSTLLSEFLNTYLSVILTPFVGRYSYYAECKYEFVRPFDFYRVANALVGTGSFLNCFSDTPQNEYAIRGMYAIWYELFRNVDLEPVGPNLPDWQEWSSTSIFDMSVGGNLLYLIYRIRPWEDDMFISAQIDDLSRHVYAPIFGVGVVDSDTGEVTPDGNAGVSRHTAKYDNLDTNVQTDATTSAGVKPHVYALEWIDQLSGRSQRISCPVPANINDVLSSADSTFESVYGLDLNTLRQSQMLERYLKRNYLFGDEYQDRMLAHYNSRVSDMRINKPEILSRSMDGYDMGQEISNVSTSAGTNVGDRTATAEIDINGEQYTTFCEEFGIVFSLVCFMPRAMYDGTLGQNYLSKQVHMPLPEFAANNEEFGRKTEIAGSGLSTGYLGDDQDNRFMFGRYPAYHIWRSRVDEVGGMFLDELQDTTFRRFWGMFSDDTTPKLNYFFLHCRPNLNMFANTVAYDCQVYGDVVNECFVERVLPTPVEVI